jgi:DNA-directed RNA polymerase subunit RPC12/RpoP
MSIINNEFKYNGEWSELFGVVFIQGLLITLTLGLYYPWGYCKIRKWVLEHTYVEDRQLTFIGNGSELFGILFLQVILTIVTVGIWALLQIPFQKLIEFDTANTKFIETDKISRYENIEHSKIQFSCKNCGRKYTVDSKYANKKGKCKNCGHEIQVPDR